ncbi:MAG: hypothetical protein ACLVI5_08310, partial [Desulfovibrio piger]|uniref:hypothetical protein n=1 Tax=Desulfovibrio piger TaxID=901 RepID=UPI00399AF32B
CITYCFHPHSGWFFVSRLPGAQQAKAHNEKSAGDRAFFVPFFQTSGPTGRPFPHTGLFPLLAQGLASCHQEFFDVALQ